MDFDIGRDLQNAYNEGYEQARNDIKRWVETVIRNTTAIMEVVALEGILEDLFDISPRTLVTSVIS